MVNYKDQLVGRLRSVALKASNQGLHLIGEGAAVATRALEQLQEKLAQYEPVDTPAGSSSKSEPVSAIQEQARDTAKVLLDEVQAVEERIKRARPARRPIQVTVEATPPEAPPARTQGRKTTASTTAPKRATARPSGFKAKRGQKHTHNH